MEAVDEAVKGRSWEPEYTDEVEMYGVGDNMTLNDLIRRNIGLARQLFASVLEREYRYEPLMYTKWGVMEWRAGFIDRARKIFRRGQQLGFPPELWMVRGAVLGLRLVVDGEFRNRRYEF